MQLKPECVKNMIVYSLSLSLIFVFIKESISSVFAGATFVLCLIYLFFNFKQAKKKFLENIRESFLFASLYFVVALGILWTKPEYMEFAMNKLETQFSLLVTPLLFSYIRFSKKDLLTASKIIFYTLSVLVFGYVTYLIFKFPDFSISLLLEQLSIKWHRTYFSMFLLFFGFVLFNENLQKGKLKKSFVVLGLTILMTQMLESRIALVCIPVILLIVMTNYSGKRKKTMFVVLLALTAGVSAIFVNNSKRAEVIIKRYTSILNDTDSENLLLLEDRLIVWKITLGIIKENSLFGVGTGDSDCTLQNECQNQTPNLTYTNPHNQYLDILLKYGCFGFILFLGMFLWPLFLSIIKWKSTLYLIFLVIHLIFFMTETVLNRQMGVLFYSFVNSLLFFYLKSKNRNTSNHTIT